MRNHLGFMSDSRTTPGDDGRRGPITLFGSIRPYDRAWLSRDVVAGITLAALAIPEVMGYTKIAGTPVITGLYTILVPVLAFAVFGSSRHLVVGGDSATAAIMFAGIAGLGVAGLQPGSQQWLALASTSALITAGFLLLARIARLGFLADFISRTVLVGFLTGVGIQVAAGQMAGLLGVPSPDVAPDRFSGTLVKLWDTLGELDQTSGATLAVSVAVLATLIVFERWINSVPGGLVAVVGAIVISWGADLSSHGVSVLGSVPSGLPSVGLPSGVSLQRRAGTAGHLRLDVPGHPRPERGHLARLRRQVPGAVRRERRPGRAVGGEPGGRADQHLRRQRQPHQDRDGGRGEEPHPGRAADDGGGGGDRAAVPDQAAPVPAQRGALGGGVPDRPEAGRRSATCGRSGGCAATSSGWPD